MIDSDRRNRHMANQQYVNDSKMYTIKQRSRTCEKTVNRRLESPKGQRHQKFKQIQLEIEKSKQEWQVCLKKYNDKSTQQQNDLNKHMYRYKNSLIVQRDPYLQQGLPGIRNDCFFSTMIQCLYSVQKFRNIVIKKSSGYYCYLLGIIFRMITYNTKQPTKIQMLEIFMKQLSFIDSSQIERSQQDSRSFLFNFFNLIGQENPGIISINFTLVYEERCHHCSECIKIQQNYFIKQKQANCFSCKQKLDIVFQNTPQYLIVLKELQQLRQYEYFAVQQNQLATYQAISNCVYQGSGFSGHYYAHRFIRQGQWGQFNDSTVSNNKNRGSSFNTNNVLLAIYKLKEVKQVKEVKDAAKQSASRANYRIKPTQYPKPQEKKVHIKKTKTLEFQAGKQYNDFIKVLFKKNKLGQIQTQKRNIKYKVQADEKLWHVTIMNIEQFFYIKSNKYLMFKTTTKQQFLKDLQTKIMKYAEVIYESKGAKQFARQDFISAQPKNLVRFESPIKNQVQKKLDQSQTIIPTQANKKKCDQKILSNGLIRNYDYKFNIKRPAQNNTINSNFQVQDKLTVRQKNQGDKNAKQKIQLQRKTKNVDQKFMQRYYNLKK